MTESNNISPMHSDFEQIKKSTEDEQEYWSFIDLCNVLDVVPIRSLLAS